MFRLIQRLKDEKVGGHVSVQSEFSIIMPPLAVTVLGRPPPKLQNSISEVPPPLPPSCKKVNLTSSVQLRLYCICVNGVAALQRCVCTVIEDRPWCTQWLNSWALRCFARCVYLNKEWKMTTVCHNLTVGFAATQVFIYYTCFCKPVHQCIFIGLSQTVIALIVIANNWLQHFIDIGQCKFLLLNTLRMCRVKNLRYHKWTHTNDKLIPSASHLLLSLARPEPAGPKHHFLLVHGAWILAHVLRAVLCQKNHLFFPPPSFPRRRLCITVVQQKCNLCSRPVETRSVTWRHLQETTLCEFQIEVQDVIFVFHEEETFHELVICCDTLEVVSFVASVETVSVTEPSAGQIRVACSSFIFLIKVVERLWG